MIISTEQAKLDTVLDPSKISFLQGVMLPVTIQSYARDFLEARALIKGMRIYFGIVRDNSLNPAHTMTQLGLEETTDANHKIALMMLEKSKEYAE